VDLRVVMIFNGLMPGGMRLEARMDFIDTTRARRLEESLTVERHQKLWPALWRRSLGGG